MTFWEWLAPLTTTAMLLYWLTSCVLTDDRYKGFSAAQAITRAVADVAHGDFGAEATQRWMKRNVAAEEEQRCRDMAACVMPPQSPKGAKYEALRVFTLGSLLCSVKEWRDDDVKRWAKVLGINPRDAHRYLKQMGDE